MRFPLARAKLNAGARGRARPRMPTGDGDCHHRQQPNEPDEDARRGCVPGAAPWPGMAWEASVNAALIAAARPAAGIMRQLLIRICMLLRGVLYPVPASSGTGGEHFLSQGIDAPVKAERSQVTTHSNNNNASPS
jgi:hypothetical protein